VTLGNTGDSQSSPFVDYAHDILYVGDNNGNLFKIKDVFLGTPTKQTNASSPSWGNASGALLVASASGNFLTSPVLDLSANRVWVGTGQGELKFVNVDQSPATVSSPLSIGTSSSINDAPIVDGTNH